MTSGGVTMEATKLAFETRNLEIYQAAAYNVILRICAGRQDKMHRPAGTDLRVCVYT